ncbi:MAG: hypothetical protein ACD_31C00005G0077 [uncultured bacterium]|uniref:Glycosyltransferase RgtA/B/C/D-like domain-containing protein n=3 Tax=Candidatus Daviesiibacteriota TaxID=1752718 RepID=A0A0G0FA25_9BACT|nr:MAG: hypothetical protein ACD_31C00005G0077 [uncultured bacterium]KKQ10370.1 MAG: hypothetical protein US19_C0006G0012 [Candidatus Daviesbacteria bacterium GW2011_GWB1_36_5]KKQ15511.1 MAG: hypothetical protein US28_C0015G0012 [Candidatus Daviesbacteria bacterium GW2011_GWA1_36_8]OGE17802.1 MAG: hypothetical protein A2858_03595 [Candidatus Daviesbacteria bacterium RIFCSPHIGHO2_01_FULL_36_37]
MNKDLKKILIFFTIWRSSLFLIAFFAVLFIPVFGGMFPYADKVLIPTYLPSWIWGFGNFDGVHYIKIAEEGYKAQFTQAFFPLFPLVISILGYGLTTFFNFYLAFFIAGILVANISFVLSLYFLFKLFNLDYNRELSIKSIYLLIAFPTAFYFSSIYTEATFLLFIVLSLLFMRKKNFLTSGIFISLASATKVIGFLLIPTLLWEIYLTYKNDGLKESNKLIKAVIGLIIAPMGMLSYMYYLKISFGSPFYFITSQPAFGTERSIDRLVLLPQIFFRYLKIFITTPINSGVFFNALLEFSFSVFILTLLIIFMRRMRLSYWFFTALNFILPTLTGTLLSMPRFVLMSFLIFPLVVEKLGKHYITLVIFFLILQIILFTLFIRGYWIA